MSRMAAALKILAKNKNVDLKKAQVDLSDSQKPFPCIPTGSVVLDYLIGGYRTESGEKRCPGIPKGRITEIYGAEGSGKCLVAGTYVQSEFGMLTIEELFYKMGKPTVIATKTVECEVKLLNENSEMESTSHFTWNGRKTIVDVKTNRGLGLQATQNHPVRVMDENGFIVWKNAGDLVVGDYLAVMTTGNFPDTSEINKSEAELLGYLVADGSYCSEGRVKFSNNDECVIEDYKRLVAEVLGDQVQINSYPRNDGNGIEHNINSKEKYEKIMSTYGLEAVTSPYKTVPQCVREGTREAQEAFLRAYVELECHVDIKKRCIEVTSASFKLLEQVQLMLLSMGYVSTLAEKKVKGYPENQYWRLNWGGEHAVRYCEEIGFISEARQQSVAEFSVANFNSNVEGVPNLSGLLRSLYQSLGDTSREDYALFSDYMSGKALPSLSRVGKLVTASQGRGNNTSRSLTSHLQNILDSGYVFTQVTEIEVEHGVPTYDVCLPETHSFWSNGLISHNTTVAIHTAINCLNAGGSVAFLDYEHAFAPTYAQDLGLDVTNPNFSLMQPTHWEEGAEIITVLAEAGVDLIIVDSLAAMVPRANIENTEVGSTGQVGHIARLQSSFLPKIVPMLEGSGSALIYINQLRSRIKTSKYDAGPDEDTSGGKSLKYYASLRMSLKRVKTEYAQVESELTGVAEKQAITNIMRAQNVKNKVSKHQGHTAEFVIRYGEGIDNVRSVIDIAEARKLIKRAGAWYSFVGSDGSELKCQGKEGLRDFFLDNEEEFQFILQQLSSFTTGKVKKVSVSDEDIFVEEADDETDF